MKRKIKKKQQKMVQKTKNERIAFITIWHLWKVKAKMKRKIKKAILSFFDFYLFLRKRFFYFFAFFRKRFFFVLFCLS